MTEIDNDNLTDVFGEVISSYSRGEAIADGVLVDLTVTNPEECRENYKYPVACTAAVWGVIEHAVNNPKWCNDLKGVVWDVLYMSRKYIVRRIDPTSHIFRVTIKGAGRKSVYDWKVVCGPGDNAEPVLTIMEPNED